MQQFQVPQFIEVEDKIFGPFTLKQFLYILGGGAIIFLLYVFLPFFFVVLIGTPVAAFFGALAFYKVNGQPFIKMLENALNYFTRSRLYIWRRVEQKKKKEEEKHEKEKNIYLPKLTESKLKELAWSLDIQEKTRNQ
jgi:hypothetical protein